MPQIDPNIVLGSKPIAMESPLDTLGKAISIKDAMSQMKYRQAQMDEVQRKTAREQQVEKAVSTGGTDEGIQSNLQSIGALPELVKFKDDLANLDSKKLTNLKTQIDTSKVKLDLVGQALGSVESLPEEQRPQAWQTASAQLVQSGAMPQESVQPYSPEGLAQAKAQALTVQQRVEASQKAAADEIAKRQATTAEGNAATTAARLEFDKNKPTGKEQDFKSWLADEIPEGKTVGKLSQAERKQYRDLYDSTHGPNANITDTERYIGLKQQEAAGTITPAGKVALAAMEKLKTLTTVAGFNLNNPAPSSDEVQKAADWIDQDPMNWSLVSGNKALADKVRAELTTRDADPTRLTAATKTLGETAHSILPSIADLQKQLDDPKVKSELGRIKGTWNDIAVGTLGADNPAFAKIRSTLSLLSSGVMRAHMGARGAQGMVDRFDKLINSTMNPDSLKGSLQGISDFLDHYDQTVYKGDAVHPKKGAASNTNTPTTGWKIISIK